MSNPAALELAEALDQHRFLLLKTAEGLTDAQARTKSTVSDLTIAAILKHVADTEEQWQAFMQRGAAAFEGGDDFSDTPGVDPRFALTDEDTVDALRERVQTVGARMAALLTDVDLDTAHALPDWPWFEQGTQWSVRRAALHLLAEMAHHAGHADIIRESIDGAQTMAD